MGKTSAREFFPNSKLFTILEFVSDFVLRISDFPA